MEQILRYFPQLTEQQQQQFAALDALYRDWNAKINVISRKDIDNLYPHHVLHSLGIAKVISFRPGTHVMDIGTGGGFPGIPLAILFPEVQFHLLDSIGKKIKVAQAVADALQLSNVRTSHKNVIEEKEKYDFVVSRAVMQMGDLVRLVRKTCTTNSATPCPTASSASKAATSSRKCVLSSTAATFGPCTLTSKRSFSRPKK